MPFKFIWFQNLVKYSEIGYIMWMFSLRTEGESESTFVKHFSMFRSFIRFCSD